MCHTINNKKQEYFTVSRYNCCYDYDPAIILPVNLGHLLVGSTVGTSSAHLGDPEALSGQLGRVTDYMAQLLIRAAKLQGVPPQGGYGFLLGWKKSGLCY